MDQQNLDLHLASASPRRQELLSALGLRFDVLPQELDESTLDGEDAGDLVLRLASEKAASAFATLDSEDTAPVLGADTIVVCNGSILGKPGKYEDALQMLRLLSGKEHQVMTAVALHGHEQREHVLSTTRVWFKRLDEDEILAYWQSKEPQDKAGAYAIQGLGAMFVERIEGSYSGVVGLPVFETVSLLAKFGINVRDILLKAGGKQGKRV